ncbi:MAG: hypothetical protein RR317_06380, partial [Bilophila sp.]
KEGMKASQWMQQHVLKTLELWNSKHAPILAKELEIDVPLLDAAQFLVFVGTGQPSFLHLAEFTHKIILTSLVKRAEALEEESLHATPERRVRITQLIQRMDMLTPEVIMETWLKPERNPEIPSPDVPTPDAPEILRMPPHVLLDWLSNLRSGYRITLQLAALAPEDVLELLWDGQGMISHLELFNLKEWQEGHLRHLSAINELQIAINEGSVLHLKQILRSMIHTFENSTLEEDLERGAKFRIILRNIPALQSPYKIAPLRSRIGTDSTSHSSIRHGMGLAIPETLPPTARRILAKNKNFSSVVLPVKLALALREVYLDPDRPSAFMRWFAPKIRHLWGFHRFGLTKTKEWRAITAITRICNNGNVVTMGGLGGDVDNGLRLAREAATQPRPRWLGLSRLSTPLSNTLKVLLGFIPAMLTFLYTQDGWVLAWFGALIWFAITGLRNIVQAILSGGGIRKSSLLRWNNYVSWTRICDSLMYTGLSVVLLEWVIRSLLLENLMGLTVTANPLLVFSIIAGANSLYIASHNVYRGFPKEAVVGNLFRSILAIPVSIFYNDLLLVALPLFCSVDPLLILQPGAAIVSKAASDTVAGVIEGVADRHNNYRLRYWDYKTKLHLFFECYGKLDLAFPDRDMLSLMAHPKEFIQLMNTEAKSLQIASIINALDLMYFWMYQPCAQQTLIAILRTMTREERVILARSQSVLLRVREVSQLFVDGLLGRNFARALSFYLDGHESYITSLTHHCAGFPQTKRRKKVEELHEGK